MSQQKNEGQTPNEWENPAKENPLEVTPGCGPTQNNPNTIQEEWAENEKQTEFHPDDNGHERQGTSANEKGGRPIRTPPKNNKQSPFRKGRFGVSGPIYAVSVFSGEKPTFF